MASQIDQRGLDIEEQIVRIRKAQQEIDQISAETRKLLAKSTVVSYATTFQGFIAVAALIGAGAAIAKAVLSLERGSGLASQHSLVRTT